jgi:dipeptide/tripeptide permease
MNQTFGSKLGKYLREKHNFVRVGAISFGSLFAIWLIWLLGEEGGIGWWLTLATLAFAAGWVWAHAMWLVLRSDFQKNSSSSKQNNSDNT